MPPPRPNALGIHLHRVRTHAHRASLWCRVDMLTRKRKQFNGHREQERAELQFNFDEEWEKHCLLWCGVVCEAAAATAATMAKTHNKETWNEKGEIGRARENGTNFYRVSYFTLLHIITVSAALRPFDEVSCEFTTQRHPLRVRTQSFIGRPTDHFSDINNSIWILQ